jgi:1,4-alpha-glucan branching enzyme
VIRWEIDESGKRATLTFTLAADGFAGDVAVVGDFNDWQPGATVLRREGDVLTASVTVEPGTRYAFRYRTADGRWFNDEAADDYEGNEFGGSNSVADIGRRP